MNHNDLVYIPLSTIKRSAIQKLFITFTPLILLSCGAKDVNNTDTPTEPDDVVISTPVDETDTPEVFADLYDIDKVLEVTVQLDDADWTALSNETRLGSGGFGGGFGGGDFFSGLSCFAGYTYFYGQVTIDGTVFENTAVRRKGFLGSSDNEHPSIKINLGKGDENKGRKYEGEKRFTLNNNKQDDSAIKQCVAYSIFQDAGVRAPRCNFARVTAQGRSLGRYNVYTHVESVKKPFLRHHFGNDTGNLYEMQINGSFIPSRIAHFEAKTNEDETDRSELMAVVTAMTASDANLVREIEKVINLDNFISFVAIEALVGHIDGFTGNQNNTLIYQNAEDGLLYFIPWGTDATFVESFGFGGGGGQDKPASIQLKGSLIQRLWAVSAFRDRYDTRVQEILDTVWDEDKLKERVDYLATIADSSTDSVNEIIEFIDERRAKIVAELAGESDRSPTSSPLAETSPPENCDAED